MANKKILNEELPLPSGNESNEKRRTVRHLPSFFRTNSNKKFFGGTLDNLVQPGKLQRLSSYVGRRDIPNFSFDDNYLEETSTPRQYYQLEPSFVKEDPVTGKVEWYADYLDYINTLRYFGANVSNHSKLNKSEAYTWDPHIDWDKFVNFREYYWLASGPDPITIYGELEKTATTFTVKVESQGDSFAYIFDPEGPDLGLIANPRITLYRGLTYTFEINSPGYPFSIKTDPTVGDSFFYDTGVSARNVDDGTVTFTVPFEAPDLLYYLSNKSTRPFYEASGMIDIRNIEDSGVLDVEKEILGKVNFTSSTGIEFINGLKLQFTGQVTPEKYKSGFWYVEGVGTAIKLISAISLESPAIYIESFNVPWDDPPFDSMPFDNADNISAKKDYIVVNRSSRDSNSWSKNNRWFHRNVLEVTAKANNPNIPAAIDQTTRAQRPIIEFEPNLKLYSHGYIAKKDVDLVDTVTTDVFSIIEGSAGYYIDNEAVLPGYRILFTADTDVLVNGRIFEVKQVLNVNVNQNEEITVVSTRKNTSLIKVTTTDPLKIGQQIRFTGIPVGGLTTTDVYYIIAEGFTNTEFAVSKTLNGPKYQLTDSDTLTMKVSSASPGVTRRRLQITLQEVEDTEPVEGQNVYVKRGAKFRGSSFYYENNKWHLSQKKSALNQAPLFDLFDENMVSYSDTTIYPYNTFKGSRIFGYKIGTGTNDPYLGFPLSYKNINNTGDIEFEFDIENGTWTYLINDVLTTVESHVGYLRRFNVNDTFEYLNGWTRTDTDTEQNVVRIIKVNSPTNIIPIDVFDDVTNLLEIEKAQLVSQGNTFYIAVNSSINKDLTDSDFWLPFDYKNSYKGNWNFNDSYEGYDIVNYSGVIYIALTGINAQDKEPPLLPTLWKRLTTAFTNVVEYKEIWTEIRTFLEGEVVRYNDFTYVAVRDVPAKTEKNNTQPPNPRYWSLVASNVTQVYSPIQNYSVDTIVNDEGISYISIAPSVGIPTSNIDYWKMLVKSKTIFRGEWDKNRTYDRTDIVSYGIFLYLANSVNIDTNPSSNIDIWTQLASGSLYPSFYNEETSYNVAQLVIEDTRPPIDYKIRVYVNDKKRSDLSLEVREEVPYIRFGTPLSANDKVVYKIRSLSNKNIKGYYEIPYNWQNNPFNSVVNSFTFGEVIDHVRTIVENTGEFLGEYPGNGNLANIGEVSHFGRKFMQHAGSMGLSTFLLVDKNANLIKSLRWAARQYTEFKKDILTKYQNTAFDGPVREVVDQLLLFHTKSKYIDKSAFYYSDMVAYGAASVREYIVADPRFPVFVIDSKFNPRTQTKRTILIYLNENLLIYGKDYFFDEDDAFVQLRTRLNVGDNILIKDYATTDGCYIPVTPTKLGIYPLYEPKIYIDDTYRPRFEVDTNDAVTFTKTPTSSTDIIDNRMILTRSSDGLYNSAIEIVVTGISPEGTEWNIDGWSSLANVKERRYDTLSNVLGGNIDSRILNEELVMHDIINDVYYKFDVLEWGGVDQDYSLKYTRTRVQVFDIPVKVIQGHDGSIIKAYDDLRDDIILEIERRIYNNVRVEYDPSIFNIDTVIGGYYRRTDFTKLEINDILLTEFLRWNSIPNLDFNSNNLLAPGETDSFRYNYNNSFAPNNDEPLYGYWRAIYKYFYDTDRPHTHPWEIQGFTRKPEWWDDVYGVAPYTSENKIMWDNIEAGIIDEPNNRRTNLLYSRPGMSKYLPVDAEGRLLSPVDSELAQNFSRQNATGRFTFGDQAPVETVWRRSSEFPFAVMIACSVLKGAEFIGKFWDRFTVKRNLAGQVVLTTSGKKISPINELPFSNEETDSGITFTSGLSTIVDEYVFIEKNLDHAVYKDTLRNLNTKLRYRLGGFSSKDTLKVLLDSRTPNASGTVFLPQENYKIFYNKSAPVETVTYSGVIVEKIQLENEIDGYRINGYDKERNSFEIFTPKIIATDPVFNVGGISESYVEWQPDKYYVQGTIVRVDIGFYRAKISHTSNSTFEGDAVDRWAKLPKLPMRGGVDAIRRRKFNDIPVRVPYGTVFQDVQSVVDFLLGYQARLQDWGFEFEEFSKDLEVPLNWLTSAKEFMFWTLQKWDIGVEPTPGATGTPGIPGKPGSVITLSPSANSVRFSPSITAAVDNLDLDFYEYSIFKADGMPLRSDLTDIFREDNGFTIVPTGNTRDGIFHIRSNLVYQEHVLLFDNESIFGDVIYDVIPGYRQGRVRLLGFKTNNWDGSYYSPGFFYDNADIIDWTPNTDYRIGDIVQYQNYYYTALNNIINKPSFDVEDGWSQLREKPEANLISNFDYRINEFRDFYNLDSDAYDETQQSLARHLTGYQKRQYLDNIIVDDVSQYKFYQGYIKEKGTLNGITKLFDVLRASGFSSIDIKEEWAFKVGDFGASDAYTEIEFPLDENKLVNNPQNILLTNAPDDSIVTAYNVPKIEVTKKPVSYNGAPFKKVNLDQNQIDYGVFKYRVAGYVKDEDVNHILYNEQDILSYPQDLLFNKDKIWIANTSDNDWTVYEYFNTGILITDYSLVGQSIFFNCNLVPDVVKNEYISVTNLGTLSGSYKVVNAFNNKIEVASTTIIPYNIESDSTAGLLYKFEKVRFKKASDISISKYNTSNIRGEKLWIDRDSEDKWNVLENVDAFVEAEIKSPEFLVQEFQKIGAEVKLTISGVEQFLFVGVPSYDSGRVIVYYRPNNEEPWVFFQSIPMPADYSEITGTERFGSSIEVTNDGSYLVIGAPYLSGLFSKYREDFNDDPLYISRYVAGDVVRYEGKLWKNIKTIVNYDGGNATIVQTPTNIIDGESAGVASTNTVDGGFANEFAWDPSEWEEFIETYEVLASGYSSNYQNQGAVFGYRLNQTTRRYERDKIIEGNREIEQILGSNDPYPNELFGSKIKIKSDGQNTWLFVGCPGFNNFTGKVQIFRKRNYTRDISVIVKSFDTEAAPRVKIRVNIPFNTNKALDVYAGSYVTISNSPIRDLNGQWRIVEADPLADHFYINTNNLLTLKDKINDITFTKIILDVNTKWEYNTDQRDLDFRNVLSSTTQLPSVSIPTIGSQYGYSIDVNDDAKNIVVTAPFLGPGAAYVYQRLDTKFELIQIIDSNSFITGTTPNLLGGSALLTSNDLFGYSVSFGNNSLFISCPNDDSYIANMGSVYYFDNIGQDSSANPYRLRQILTPPEFIQNERFGIKIDLNPSENILVVSSAGGNVNDITTFDMHSDRLVFTNDSTRNYVLDTESNKQRGTTFDFESTNFYDRVPYTGAVYVFNKFDDNFIYADKLAPNIELETNDDFGAAVTISNDCIVAGAPNRYKRGVRLGTALTFSYDTPSWKVKESQKSVVDVYKFKKAFIYDSYQNVLIDNLDILDPAKGKIASPAEQEIKYQTYYDPAVYEFGTDTVSVDRTAPWTDDHVGELWWDLSTFKYTWYEQGDSQFKNTNWGGFFPGSIINVYEWVESRYLPTRYNSIVTNDTANVENLTGLPKDFDDFTYSSKLKYDPITKARITFYYFWVNYKSTVPNVPFRRIPATDVIRLIVDPKGVGYRYIAVTDNNSLSLVNLGPELRDKDISLNIQFYEVENTDLITHREYALISENDINAVIPTVVEQKWFDSLVGYNIRGQVVPDPRLNWRQRYGGANEPRQGWFKNRFEALKQFFEYVNEVLASQQLSDEIDFTNLNRSDPIPTLKKVGVPSAIDLTVDILDELRFVGTAKIKPAKLSLVIIEGKITTVFIDDPGFGYKTPPIIRIKGVGTGAELKATIDTDGKVIAVNIIKTGSGYDTYSTVVTVRNFSVLVKSDEEANGGWSLQEWDTNRKRWNRVKTQAYDVKRYWKYKDWYAEGFSSNSDIRFSIDYTKDLNGLPARIGDVVKVRNVGYGSWLLLQRKAVSESPDFTDDYIVVGKQNDTIEFSDRLYNLNKDLGFDSKTSFDIQLYDQAPTIELRIILESLRDNILINDLRTEYINAFFNSVQYALNENLYVDWVFKTSFLKINHSVGSLKQRTTFQSDVLESYQQFIEEVKPYKTKIREFVSSYTGIGDQNVNDATDMAYEQITDFDLFSYYNVSTERIERTTEFSSNINSYPWKDWLDNYTYGVTEIIVTNSGNGYVTTPKVIISGNGTGAKATAYIANSRVYKIVVDDPGTGYTITPTVFISGGNGDRDEFRAIAYAKIGNTKVRTSYLSLKYDRYLFNYTVDDFTFTDRFTGSGVQKTFKLTYAPDPKKVNFDILVDNIEIFGSQFDVEIREALHDTYTTLEGFITFKEAPITGVSIIVKYHKNERILGATDRINYKYNPNEGMYGKDLSQLMVGVDYGGVQLTSIDFDIGGGWDVLPWDGTSWDNIILSNDDYVIASDGTTRSFDLPYVPAIGEIINVYISSIVLDSNNIPVTEIFGRAVKRKTVRIDDPYFDLYDGVTVQPNGLTEAPEGVVMKSFVGNGIDRTIILPESYDILETDFITLRKSTSDGTILPTDRSLIDSFISGGDLSYTTAKGIAAEEIIIDGDDFVTPDTSHGPEELIQGHVVDALDIKVYHAPAAGGPNVNVQNYTGDGVTKTFNIGVRPSTLGGLLVINNGVVCNEANDSILPDNDPYLYQVNFNEGENTITLSMPPAFNDKLVIITIDTAGFDITEKVTFIGDGSTNEFLTSARFNGGDISGFVTINGLAVEFTLKEDSIPVDLEDVVPGRRYRIIRKGDTDFISVGAPNNDAGTIFVANGVPTGTGVLTYVVNGNIIVEFAQAPEEGDVIQIILFNGTVKKWSEVTTQFIPMNVNNEPLTEYELSPAPANIEPHSTMAFVIVDNEFLQAPDYEYFIYDGSSFQLTVKDLRYYPTSLSPEDINLYRNGQKMTVIQDWILDSINSSITLNLDIANIGDEITVEILYRSDFKIENGKIIFNTKNYSVLNKKVMRVTTFTNHDIIKIKTSNVGFRFDTGYDVYQYDIVKYDILSTATNTSGIFNLPRPVSDTSGIFVGLSRKLLSPNVDYVVLDNRQQIKVLLPVILTGSDYIEIVTFNDQTVRPSYGFKNFKDMMNRNHYKRLDSSRSTYLKQDLTYLDTQIVVFDATILSDPSIQNNLPGIIEIEGERIEYFKKEFLESTQSWILSQLRRGTLGTGIKDVYLTGAIVNDIGQEQSLPYADQEIKETFFGDGSTRSFDLNFVPKVTANTVGNLSINTWYREKVLQSTLSIGASEIVVGNVYRIKVIGNTDFTKLGATSNTIGNFFRATAPGKTTDVGVVELYTMSSIPLSFGQCDEIEVFVGGVRLRKAPTKIYDQNLAQDSYNSVGDKDLEAEFSVNGTSNAVRLTKAPGVNEVVVVVRKVGRTWQKVDENTSLAFSDTDVARFLRAKQVILPK